MVKKTRKESWPSKKDIEKFLRNNPQTTVLFDRIFWGLLTIIGKILSLVAWPINFLRELRIIGPPSNKGLGRSLVVCWSDFRNEGHIYSSFGKNHYQRVELGFDMPVHDKKILAAKILERLQNLRINYGPGNIRPEKEYRDVEKRDKSFLVTVQDDGMFFFSRFLNYQDNRVGVVLEKENLEDCLKALERVMKEPPDQADLMWHKK